MYAVIIVLLVVLILAGIAASAVQQHKQKKESELRDELNRYKTVIDETEGFITAAGQMPVSQQLISILHRRILFSLKQMHELSPTPELKQRIKDTASMIKTIDISEPAPDQSAFILPANDKVIIKYIQAVKKLRNALRSEQSKSNISPKVFAYEDKMLERLQLRVNVETLAKRAKDAMKSNMQGSARQYLEKGVQALKNHKPQDEYTTGRAAEFEQMLGSMEGALKKFNAEQIEKDKEQENPDLDALFAPKKKW